MDKTMLQPWRKCSYSQHSKRHTRATLYVYNSRKRSVTNIYMHYYLCSNVRYPKTQWLFHVHHLLWSTLSILAQRFWLRCNESLSTNAAFHKFSLHQFITFFSDLSFFWTHQNSFYVLNHCGHLHLPFQHDPPTAETWLQCVWKIPV